LLQLIACWLFYGLNKIPGNLDIKGLWQYLFLWHGFCDNTITARLIIEGRDGYEEQVNHFPFRLG